MNKAAIKETAPKELASKEPVKKEEPRHWIAEWTVTVLMLLFGTSTLVQAYVVPTESMDPTIHIGDHLFVDKLAYSPAGPLSKHLLPYEDVKRGDIIVFRYPLDIKQNYVKRCIGLPGDHIRIVERQLYVNGKAMNEPYKVHRRNYTDPYLDNFPSVPSFQVYPAAVDMLRDHVKDGELIVPADNYFAMGDNRDNSADSRFWGFVPRENIVGKPVVIYWSYDAPTEHWIDDRFMVEHIKDVALHFFSKTRWDKTFHLLRPYPLS
jgi:signal peptidase I